MFLIHTTDNGSTIEARVVYHYVDVPIGSDLNTATRTESNDTAIDHIENNLSFNNTADVLSFDHCILHQCSYRFS